MFTRGEFTIDNVTYGAIVKHTKTEIEVILVNSGTVISAYKADGTGSYSYNNVRAKELATMLRVGVRGCTSKNGTPMPFDLGAMTSHEFIKTKVDYTIQLHRGELVGAYIQSDSKRVELNYVADAKIPSEIPYVKLTEIKKDIETSDDELDAVPVRSVQEIALEKEDITWLNNKKYYIVNDDATAEQLFAFLDNYKGVIAYDTETTGLHINCFSKINSSYQKTLQEYNELHPKDQIRADKLVGIIFCIENDVSYYFPCFNRKFKNLYEDLDSEVRKQVVNNIKARYTVGDLATSETDMAKYIRETSAEELPCDVILMERCRNILERGHICAHNGTFEYKVGMCYDIDTNLRDDTMIMHQLMYKFRSTTSNRGEPSNLKYLAKRELGVDQWELGDFFTEWKADTSGTVRNSGGKGKKAGSRIDFSYMDYDGTRVYAPTDGDVTYQLFNLYKTDMVKNHKEMQYIYDVEIIVSCAVAYMEFYGHRLNEAKINGAKLQTEANIAETIYEIRKLIDYNNVAETLAYTALKEFRAEKHPELTDEEFSDKLEELTSALVKATDENAEKVLNLASPAQVCELFYDKLEIPTEKRSVAKSVVKALLKEKNDDGTNKYPVVHLYSKYKNEATLLTKFFGNLQAFMYPGGFIFSGYGQISTATGRMSCSKPNAQQYPKSITKIVEPRPGYVMMDADYSQIEYRVLTALAGNDWLAELFSNPDSDYHTLMASLMYEVPYAAVTPQMRSAAKSFNFGIPYGMGLGSLAILLTGKNTAQTRDEAAEKYEAYFKNQPKTRKFFDKVKEMAQVNKYTKTLFNRYRYYSFEGKDGVVDHGKKAAALRQAGNAVIQGCLGPDTLIETKEFGIKRIGDLDGYSGLVWDGYKWSHGDVLYSGKKQKCIITFTNGQKFICSPIHKFLKLGTDANNENNYIECQNLKVGDKIAININSDLEVVIPESAEERYSEFCKTLTSECDETAIDSVFWFFDIAVESVEITDEYIDMYDVCNTAGGYYVADGIITHNTAADIFKIGVARNFSFIRKNKLFGDVLITNMVHDEQLIEVNAQKLNVQRVLAEVGSNMQFKLEGFPPLYIGAGVGKAWGTAKGKMAEIHPVLLQELTEEARNIPIHREDTSTPVDPDKVVEYFDSRVYEFRRKKVEDYLINPENWHQVIHPAIGSLVNLQFNYGRGDEAKAYTGPNGEKYTDQEFLLLNIGQFIEENNLDIKAEWFAASDLQDEKEEDTEYVDGEEDEILDELEADVDEVKTFKIIESDKMFGSSVHDFISTFGTCILAEQKLFGIDTRTASNRKINAIAEYLNNVQCEPEDQGALEVVFLTAANVLNRTGVFVRNIDPDKLQKMIDAFEHKNSDYTEGDVKNRSQAK